MILYNGFLYFMVKKRKRKSLTLVLIYKVPVLITVLNHINIILVVAPPSSQVTLFLYYLAYMYQVFWFRRKIFDIFLFIHLPLLFPPSLFINMSFNFLIRFNHLYFFFLWVQKLKYKFLILFKIFQKINVMKKLLLLVPTWKISGLGNSQTFPTL